MAAYSSLLQGSIFILVFKDDMLALLMSSLTEGPPHAWVLAASWCLFPTMDTSVLIGEICW